MSDTDNISDGFHTFGELYEHRRALTAVLAAAAASDGDSWRSREHHPDGDPMFDGCFIVGIKLPTGTITYHFELQHWGQFAAVPELPHAPKWDGATPQDTVARLFELARLVADQDRGSTGEAAGAPHPRTHPAGRVPAVDARQADGGPR